MKPIVRIFILSKYDSVLIYKYRKGRMMVPKRECTL